MDTLCGICSYEFNIWYISLFRDLMMNGFLELRAWRGASMYWPGNAVHSEMLNSIDDAIVKA